MQQSRRPTTGVPVARLVAPIVWWLTLLVVLMAGICVIGIALSIQAVSFLTDSVQPTISAQQQVGDDMSGMQGALDGWARGADVEQRQAFLDISGRIGADLADLAARTRGDSGLSVLVTRERSSVDTYVARYAGPQARSKAIPATGPGPLYVRGRQLYAVFSADKTAVDQALADRSADAGSAAVLRFRLTIVAVVILLGLSWWLIGRARTRLLHELSEPLTRLEKVVARMLRNDPEGRADQDAGPKEVRAIARALNDFADAQSRARAVEGRIQDELHVLDSAKDDFVSNVSHELRTPLTTISGYLEIVAEEFEGRIEPRHERMLEATRRNVVRLRALIDDLLALSKAETRPSELEPSDIVSMIAESVTDVKMTAARRGITVGLTAPAAPMLVVCDRAMLYRAFLNVLTNAVKFSHESGHVDVRVKRTGNRVEVAVADRGIGIPRVELDRLGTRFFRASNAMTNEIAGTGLGLRIVQTIIDKHDGDVVIESAEGVGTTVFIRFRLHDQQTRRRVRAVPGDPGPAVGAPGPAVGADARRG